MPPEPREALVAARDKPLQLGLDAMAEDEGVPDRERALRDDVLSGDPPRRPAERITGRLVMTSEP